MKETKKIIFCGDLTQNNGPANVNKCLYKYSNYIFIDTKEPNKLRMIFKYLINIYKTDLIIFSCNYRMNYYFFRLAKLLRKKTIYLMHGYSKFEAKENKINNSTKVIKHEENVIKKVDLIITVSSAYKKELDNYIPQYSNKIHYITNGIEKEDYEFINNDNNSERQQNKIVVCGGNRVTKCNSMVCKAIENLNKDDYNCNLDVFGLLYGDNEKLVETKNIKILGRVPQEQLFLQLKKSKLFILNCKVESFGLSVIDALMCGCNIMVSERAGITSILSLQENDIIHNFDDIDELCEKIKYNLEHDNNDRIKNSIDFEHYSWKNVANRLERIVLNFINNKEFKDII